MLLPVYVKLILLYKKKQKVIIFKRQKKLNEYYLLIKLLHIDDIIDLIKKYDPNVDIDNRLFFVNSDPYFTNINGKDTLVQEVTGIDILYEKIKNYLDNKVI